MPIPKPRKNEDKDAFINRCMSDDVMKSEFKDNKQRIAVCMSRWKDFGGEGKSSVDVPIDLLAVKEQTEEEKDA